MRRRKSKYYFDNEKRVMQELGLIPTKRSGSGWVEKEDGYNDYVVCQHKSTDANSYRLQRDDLDKLEYHAMVEHKNPLLILEFLTDGKLYAVVPLDDIKTVSEHILPEQDKNSLKRPTEPHRGIVEGETTQPTKRKVVKSSNRSKYWETIEKEREEKRG